jgi:hypothetical protein
MKVNGKTIRRLGPANSLGPLAIILKEIGSKTKNLGLESMRCCLL